MDALPFRPIELVAVEPSRNIRRRWRVVAVRDLFGDIIIETSWGRMGARGQMLARTFTQEREALRYVRALLARRRSASRRLGTAYV
jgi:predicted DNA-binding WGR domain protein